jgi:hypothetical protein
MLIALPDGLNAGQSGEGHIGFASKGHPKPDRWQTLLPQS